MIKYIIPLDPITKKNHQQIFKNKATGKPFITPSPQYKQYEQSALWYLKPPPKEPISSPVNIKCLFYMATKRNSDINNLLEAVTDVLVKARIVEDDNHKVIAGHDGTRVLYDKANPRTEIYITEMEENQ